MWSNTLGQSEDYGIWKSMCPYGGNCHFSPAAIYYSMECEPSEAKLPLFQEKPEIQIFIGNDVSNIKKQNTMCAMSLQSCPTPCDPIDYSPPGSSIHGDSPGKNTGVGYHALLQGIFLTQGMNPSLLCLLHLHAGSLPLALPGKHRTKMLHRKNKTTPPGSLWAVDASACSIYKSLGSVEILRKRIWLGWV